jgi:hypothetical protein
MVDVSVDNLGRSQHHMAVEMAASDTVVNGRLLLYFLRRVMWKNSWMQPL